MQSTTLAFRRGLGRAVLLAALASAPAVLLFSGPAHAGDARPSAAYPLAASDALWKQVFGSREDAIPGAASHTAAADAVARQLSQERGEREAYSAPAIPVRWLTRYGSVPIEILQ